jgi:hypothetical protein
MPRSRSLRAATAFLALGLGAAGCGPIGWRRVTLNHPLDAREGAFIVSGKTTWDEVTARLGAPNRLVAVKDGMIADYVYSDGKSFSVDFGWPLGFIGPVPYAPHSFTLGGQGIGKHTFQVAFDAGGVVEYADFRRGQAASEYRVWPFAALDAGAATGAAEGLAGRGKMPLPS